MSTEADRFLLALCHPGAERALVDEAGRTGLKRAFSTKGLVTLKSDRALDVDFAFPSVFALHQGLSLGAVDDDDALALATGRAAHVQRVELGASSLPRGVPVKEGELVATVVEAGDKRWASLHRHAPGRGLLPLRSLPPEAPSRAWLKIEEAARLWGLDLVEGERALELGSAPGGAAWALLSRGLTVTGVDPNDVDARVAAHTRYTHIKRTSTSVDPASVGRVDWLLLDVNVPPGTALRGALPFLRAHAATLRGLVFTLKLKDWSIAREVPGWRAGIRRAAPGLSVEARQLWSSGQEICAVGRGTSQGHGRAFEAVGAGRRG